MRGSIYYQTGKLSAVLFKSGLTKQQQKATGYLANATTIEKYRDIWNQLGFFSQEIFGLKDLQQLSIKHIEAFILHKIDEQVSEQYLEFISSSFGKLQTALIYLQEGFFLTNTSKKKPYVYDFSIRDQLLHEARKNNLVYEKSDDPRFCRAYDDPCALIQAIQNPLFQLAATIQLESGARIEGVKRIDETMLFKQQKLKDNKLIDTITYHYLDDQYCEVPQLQGIIYDSLEATNKGTIFDVEKGGKPGILLVKEATYKKLKDHLFQHDCFLLNVNHYRTALKKAALQTKQRYEGTHGLRWNFARERFFNIQAIGGLTYEQALQQVSWEMKHERASITEHYLR